LSKALRRTGTSRVMTHTWARARSTLTPLQGLLLIGTRFSGQRAVRALRSRTAFAVQPRMPILTALHFRNVLQRKWRR
jgi:hypothetical protein